MGARNFANVNTSSYYVWGMGFEDEETGEYEQPDEWMIDYIINDLKEHLQEKMPVAGWQVSVFKKDQHDCDGNRSYPTTTVGDVAFCIGKDSKQIYGSLKIQYTAGYYEGATWDFQEYFDFNGETFDTLDEVADVGADIELEADLEFQAALKIAALKMEQMKADVEQIFAAHSEGEYHLTGVFSNGEAVYTKKVS